MSAIIRYSSTDGPIVPTEDLPTKDYDIRLPCLSLAGGSLRLGGR